jgi:peptide/nickel transport system substrate-binding protein
MAHSADTLGDLVEEIRSGRLSRRAFLRKAGATGMYAGSAVGLASLLSACGVTASPSPFGTNPSGTSAATSSKPATPKQLVIGSVQDIVNIDPASGNINSISNGAALYALYDPLFIQVGDELVPVLGESVEPSSDGRQWTIRLVSNGRFQDGSPVTSQAVKFTFERMLRLNQGANLWDGIVDPEGIEAVDDLTVRVNLLNPFAAFPQTLPALVISNPKLLEANVGDDDSVTWLQTNSAGSGPFRIKRWEPTVLYEFEADPDYWRGWRKEGRLSGFLWQIIPESSAAKIALQSGEIHTWTNLPPQDVAEIEAGQGLRVDKNPGNTVHRIVFHNQNPRGFTADRHVRRALTHAFNKQAVLDLYSGFARAVNGPIPDGFPGADPSIQTLPYDLAKAREELAASAWPNGGFKIEFLYPNIELAKNIGLVLLEGASNLNIQVEVVGQPNPNVLKRRADPATMPDALNLWFGPNYRDADAFLNFQYYSGRVGTGNYSYLNSPAIDDQIEAARQTSDTAERDKIYAQVQQQLVDDAVDIFTVVEDSIIPFRDTVRGHQYSPSRARVPYLYDLWIED